MIRDGILAEQILIIGVKVVLVIWFESCQRIWNLKKQQQTISLDFSLYHFQYYDQKHWNGFEKKAPKVSGKDERKPLQGAILNYLKKVGEAKLTEKYDLKN